MGSHLADDLLRDGHSVTILDNLSRRGAERNLSWLKGRHLSDRLRFVHGDVRASQTVRGAAADADVIYHLAAQVAVTSSVADPRSDFEINALGTLNVLEAARLSGRRPIVVATSTNKVYGGLSGLRVEENETRYQLADFPHGIPESQPLDFHSPYGCSKGAMDQYVRDYWRIYSLPTVVFRMSCIYGDRQFGTEDQGWIAHFLISAKTGVPVTIYGDGKQVRDVLFIDDLVQALRLAVDQIEVTAGEVYNVGGGPANTLAVWSEFSRILEGFRGGPVSANFAEWRPGDQRCYVSDIRKIRKALGWEPRVDVVSGIRRLWEWVSHEGGYGPAADAAKAVSCGGAR